MMTLNDFLSHEIQEARDSDLERSFTCLQVDKWGLRKGQELARKWENYDPLSTGGFALLADCHAAVFEPKPKLAEAPADEERAEWFRSLMQTDDYRSLHKQTRGNLVLSHMVAIQIADQWMDFLEAQGGDTSDAVEVARSTSRALKQSRKVVGETIEAMEGLDGGGGIGGDGSKSHSEADVDRIVAVFQKTRNDAMLRRILESSGRFRRLAQSLQRAKTIHACDDMVGVTLGNKISRLCLNEQMALVSEEMELLSLYRIANNRAMIKDYQGIEPQGRGPIIVVVDESGSMKGAQHETAKGLALAMGWIAKKQRRWIAFVGFAGGTQGNVLAMPPSQWDQDRLISWLTHFYAGGTDLDVPVRQIPGEYWTSFLAQGMPRGKTDVLMITDAVVRCSDEMAEQYNRWRKLERVTSYGIVLNYSAGDFEKICDKTFCCKAIDVSGEAVQAALSI